MPSFYGQVPTVSTVNLNPKSLDETREDQEPTFRPFPLGQDKRLLRLGCHEKGLAWPQALLFSDAA